MIVLSALVHLAFGLSAVVASPLSRGSQPTSLQVPQGGQAVLPADSLSVFGPFGQKEKGKYETVTVTGQPFAKAIRATTLLAPTNQWELQLGTWIQKPIQKGDVLLIRFYVRSIKGQAETGEARTKVGVSTGGPAWASSMTESIGIPKEWKLIEVPFAARYDTPVNGAIIAFDMGFAPQSFEIGGIELLNYGKSKTVAELPRTRSDYAGQEDDATWRKEANARIEKIRKGDLNLVVLDDFGKPVSNAKVSVKMRRHAFRFGTAVAADTLVDPSPTGDKYRQTILENYNTVVIENHLKWTFWETWGRPDGDKAVDWAVENGLNQAINGPIIWGGWTNLPPDLKDHATDQAYIDKRIRDHITKQIGTYAGKLNEWEVINEPFAQHDLWELFGYGKMAEYFRAARKVSPKAHLTINDYPPLDGAAKSNEHLNAFYKYIEDLQKAKAPLDGIGFQCHFGSNIVPPERVVAGLDRFAKFNLPISITELDMESTDEDLQRRYMRDFLTAAFSHPSVDSILMWGFWEGKHWLPTAALYRWDWSVKPNGQAWLDLVKRDWWTNAEGQTSDQGAFKTRGFLGDYEITVTPTKGKSKKVFVTLTKGVAPIKIRMDGTQGTPPKWLEAQIRAETVKRNQLAAGLPILAGTAFNLLADKAVATAEVIPANGQSFTSATRFSVTKPTANPWEAQALIVTSQDIRKGDSIRVVFYVRSAPGTTGGKVTASFQTGGPDYSVLHAEVITPTSEWKRVEMRFKASLDRAAGGTMLVLQMGHQAQTIEVGGVSATNFGNETK